MQTLTLYPSEKNVKLSILSGAGAIALGGYLIFLNGGVQFTAFAVAAMAGGVWMIVQGFRQRANPRPVFQADADGFSVKGKAKRPWSEFRGAHVYNASSGLFSLAKMVRVKVGTSVLGGYVQINALQMSDAAAVMAMQIERFAEAAKSGSVATTVDKYAVPSMDAQSTTRPTRPTRPMKPESAQTDFGAPTPQPTFAQRLQSNDGGPVQSTPRLGERLFGRRKVL